MSAHLRTRHKLPSRERQRHLQQVKEQPRIQSMQGHIEKNGCMGNYDTGRSDGFQEQQNSTNKLFIEEDNYRMNSKEFRVILQQLSVANIERERQYIKNWAPEDFLSFLRSLPSNVDKFQLTYEQFYTMKHSKVFKRLGSPAVHRRVARELMTTDVFLKLFAQIIPQLLKIASLWV